MTGRPDHDHRRMLNGMLWILRTGAPWIDLPPRHGPVGRCRPGFKAGVIAGVPRRFESLGDVQGAIDWDLPFVDATMIHAHHHTAGARRTGAVGGEATVDGSAEALGRSQGGFSTKLHLRAEGQADRGGADGGRAP